MKTIKELKKEIETYEKMLLDSECSLSEQTWVELQIKELKKEIKSIRTEAKTNKSL